MIRLFRLVRLIRVAKLGRYSTAMHLLVRVLGKKKTELAASASLLFLLLIVSSSLVHLAEHVAQPDDFGSIPASMWWAIVTLTTVGYGDVYPVTAAGKVMAGCIAVLGIGLFALPTGILAMGFLEEVQGKKTCPHCGKEL
jgi:voltage-gated potassium channel